MQNLNPGTAYWEQRHILRELKPRIEVLSNAIDRKSDFSLFQWAQLSAFLLSFQPDCILELGRGMGNSTAAFLETAAQLGRSGKKCRVVSVCISDNWHTESTPRLQKICNPEWFAPLNGVVGDILVQDYRALIGEAKRVALFWDAHGFEVAGCVLGEILPIIAANPHVVMMHDMSDQRYLGDSFNSYIGQEIWSGTNAAEGRLILGHINSAVAQAISIVDFSSRNGIVVDSGDHGIRDVIGADPQKVEEMRSLLGNEMFQLQGHWFWFTLTGNPRPVHFPKFRRPGA